MPLTLAALCERFCDCVPGSVTVAASTPTAAAVVGASPSTDTTTTSAADAALVPDYL